MDYFNESIFRYIPETGLYLVNHNTGTGKTTATIKGMHRLARDSSFHRRQLFVTGMWNNIPVKELQAEYNIAGDGPYFEQEVLVIRSTGDTFASSLAQAIKQIPHELACQAELSSIQKLLQNLADQSLARGTEKSFYISVLREKLQQEIAVFRKAVTRYLCKQYQNLDDRILTIRPGNQEAWVSALFPASRVSDPVIRICLLTTKMLLLGGASVVKEGSVTYLNQLVPGALVYLDEFDASKALILDHIVEESLQSDIDLIHANANTYKWLLDHVLPDEFLRIPEDRAKEIDEKRSKRGAKKLPSLADELAAVKAAYLNLGRQYRTDRNFKLELLKNKAGLLFSDYSSRHHAGLANYAINIRYPEYNQIYKPDSSNSQLDETNNPSLQGMIWTMTRCFRNFVWLCKHLAENEAAKVLSKSGPDFLMVRKSKLDSIFSHFSLEAGERVLAHSIVESTVRAFPLDHGKAVMFEHPLYKKGFQISDLSDDADHEYQTRIRHFSIPCFPEHIVTELATNAFVIGLSATATMPTATGNYDLDALRMALGSAFYEPTAEDLAGRKQDYQSHTAHYRQASGDKFHQTKLTVINRLPDAMGELECVQLWRDSFDLPEAKAQRIYTITKLACTQALGEKDDRAFYLFLLNRYFRAYSLLHSFATTADNHACLAFFPAHLQIGKTEFDWSLLADMATALGMNAVEYPEKDQEEYYKSSAKPLVVKLTKHNIKAEIQELKALLKAKVRILAFTAYATSGLGVNLQYEPAEDLDYLYHPKRGKYKEIDWNGIYLDRPTNMIAQCHDGQTRDERMASLLKRLAAISYIYANQELSYKDYKAFQESSLGSYQGKPVYQPTSQRLLDCCSVRYATLTVLIQALGRLERTSNKNAKLFLAIDQDLVPILTGTALPQDMLPLHSYSQILEQLKDFGQPGQGNPVYKRYERQAEHTNICIKEILSEAKYIGWNADTMQWWSALRQELITMPVCLANQDRPEPFANMFLDFSLLDDQQPRPSYCYRQKEDYECQEIDVERNQATDGWHSLSEQASGLPLLMRVPELQAGFIARKYATTWEPGFSLPTPVLFNNIYKGMLGEVALTIVLEDILKQQLDKPSAETFELFDMSIACTIFFDSKYWMSGHEQTDLDAYLRIVQAKLERCKGKIAVLVRTSVVPAESTLFTISTIEPERIKILNRLLVDTGKEIAIDQEALHFLSELIRRHT